MNFNQNRLRFVHCEHLFSNFQEITEYVRSVQYDRASLYAEPMIFKYGDEKNPCIVLAIGSVGEGKFIYDTETGEVLNETFYIDFSQAERDIKKLYELVGENKEEIERIDGIVKNMIIACGFNEDGKYIPELDDHILGDATSLFVADKMLSEYIIALERRQELYVEDTPSIDLTVEKNAEGTTLSADVKLGTKIYDGQIVENIIIEQEDGIFTSVDLDYYEENSKLTLTINGDQKKDIKLPVESHVIKGEYDPYTEKLILTLKNAVEIDGEINDKVEINMARLIDEWDVLGEASETPIVLTREHIQSVDTEHEGMYEWQDILKADVRILDKTKMPDNILSKDSSGKFLYVEGSAANISYLRNDEKISVQKGLDEKLSKTDISQRADNTIHLVNDGLYSFVNVSYDNKKHSLVFERTNPKGEILKSEYELNSVEFIQKAYFDTTTEEIVIIYTDGKGEMQELRIPLQIVVNQLEVDNTDKTVTLTIVKNPQGQDKISGEVNIAKIEDNILENVAHSLYVRGTANNIKMIDTTMGVTVEAAVLNLDKKVVYLNETEIANREAAINDVLSKLHDEFVRASEAERLLQDNLDAEERRAIAAEEELTRNLNSEIDRAKTSEESLQTQLNAEITRAESVENVLNEKIENEILRSIETDEALNTKIVTEVERATAAEHTLKVDLINESERAILKEEELERNLNSEIERSTTKDAELKVALENEIARAIESEDELEDAIVDEIKRAQDAELILRDSIVAENQRAEWAEHQLGDRIDAEIVRADAAEKALSNRIDAETARATRIELEIATNLETEILRAKAAEDTIDEKLETEISRSYNKDVEIIHNLEQAKLDLSYVVKNSGTISLTKTTEEVGTSIIGKVNVSTEEGNIINGNGEPLFAAVDLLYDPKNNTLTLTRSGAVDKTIKLNEGSLIQSIVYDDVTKELIITYFDSYGNEREERVNVRDLFNQWDVETNHLGAVQLTKELNYDGNGTDKLVAEVVLSTLNSNLLVNDKGSLYVSNSAANIVMEDNTSVLENIHKLKKADIALENKINDETLRATLAEENLQKNIEDAVKDSIQRDTDLTNALESEIDRAERVEGEISSKLDSEIERSIAKDKELETRLVEEIHRASNAELDLTNALYIETDERIKNDHLLSDAIAKEEASRIEADKMLNHLLNDEITNRINGDALITEKLNYEVERLDKKDKELEDTLKEEIANSSATAKALREALDAEIKAREEGDRVLTDALEDEVDRAKDAEKVLGDRLDAEIARAKSIEETLQSSLESEIERAVGVETNLSNRIDNEILRATEAENANFLLIHEETYRAQKAEHDLKDALKAEQVRSEAAEQTLQSNIDLEQSRAEGRETELQTLINNNSLNLANEIARAIAAENELRNDINEETARAIAADDTLRGLISSETERAVKEEARLESLINTEIGRAQTAEAELAKDIESVKNTANNNSEKIDDTIVQVEEIVKTYAMSVKDTATVQLTKEVIDAGGFIVSADVKLSSNSDNQIIKYEDGLYTNVLLTYSSNNNTLHFTANGITQDIPLTSVSTIDKINYLPDTNEIEIVYVSNGEIQRVKFPASGMFKPITTNNDESNVVLKQTTNAEGATELSANLRFADNLNNDNTPITLFATEDNKLKAKLNIADSVAANNILEITSDGNSVWVNGIATNIEMVNKQLGLGTSGYPFYEADTVEEAIHYLDGRVDELRDEFNSYLQEDLVNSMQKDINNLKTKTDINAITTPGIDLKFESTESESSLKANIIISDDPHNLLTVYSDTWNEFEVGSAHPSDGTGNFLDDTYNGILFDGNIDYLTFSHTDILSGGTDHFEDWTRHLQIKRDDEIFESKEEALAHLNSPEFLLDKKDGEPLLARYKFVDEFGNVETSFILGFAREVEGQKSIQTLDNKGTLINRLEYIPNATQIVTKDAFGKETVTNVTPESLYLEYTDSSSLKHTIVTPLKELVEEYVYPQSKATFEGKVVTEAELGYVVDGVDNAKEHMDEEGNPIYVETTVRQFHNVNFDIERNEDNKSVIKADVDYYDCGEYDGEDYIKPESYVTAYFNALDTTTDYLLVNGEAANNIVQVYVDGVEKGTLNTIKFDTVGEHKVKIVFSQDLTNMASMFNGVKMSTITLTDLITKNVTDMNHMFANCSELKTINIGVMDTTNVIDMDYMVSNCEKLQILNINGLNTQSVVGMEGMFSGLPLIESIDISSFNLLKVANMSNMFENSVKLTFVKIMTEIDPLVKTTDMFNGITTNGELHYNINYNYARIITALPKTWNAIEA